MPDAPFLIDIDGVCLDFLTPFVDFLRQRDIFPKGPFATHDLYNVYPQVPPEDLLALIKDFQGTGTYFHLGLMVGVVESLHRLKARHPESLFIAVSACGDEDFAVRARKYQLRHLPFDATLVLPIGASKKAIYRQFQPGVVIDDHPRHVDDAFVTGHWPFLFDQPYNQEDTFGTRVKTWEEIVEHTS